MKLPTKLAVVGIVVAGGTAAALMFRKTPVEAPAAPSVVASPSPASTATAPANERQGVPPPTPAASKALVSHRQAPQESQPESTPSAAESRQLPPRIADAFPALQAHPTTEAAAAQQPIPPLPNLRGALDSTVSLPKDRPHIVSKPAAVHTAPLPWRSHTVVDGDTLSSLATRYLGSAGRFAEILEANRTVVRSPDMLPIGAVLRIPPESGPTTLPAPLLDGTRFDHLVPIPAGALSSRSGD